MLKRMVLLVGLSGALLGTSMSSYPGGAPERARRLQERVQTLAMDTDPKQDAARAIAAGDFRLIVSGQYEYRPLGVICFTPDGRSSGVLTSFSHGDYITPDISAKLQYIQAYNIAIVESPSFPDADICRVAASDDPRVKVGTPLAAQAARAITTPVRSLYEAARRGDVSDVRRFFFSILGSGNE